MLVVLALLTACVAGCGGKDEPEPVTPEPPAGSELQAALDEIVAAGVPGVALAIRTGNRTEFLSAGRASLDPPRPISPADRYRIASVTKSFTAAIVMQLVAEGKLALTRRVAFVAPGLLPAGSAITVGQLLGHTSGLPDYVKDPRFAEIVGNGGRLTPELVLGLVADEPLEFRPGSKYGYSDTDNIVAGLVIERVTRNSFEEELQSRILGPQSLEETSLAHRFAFPKPHARGYQFDPEAGGGPEDVTDVPIDADGAWASGALVSTPQDVARFFAALLSGEIVRGPQLEAMKRTRPGAGSPPGPGDNHAGLGVFRWEVPCGAIWGHTGSFPGFRTLGAATADGSASAGMVVNATEIPERAERAVLRAQTLVACRILR